MHEGLNHWTFVYASYVLAIVSTAALIGWSLTAMRNAESRRDRSRER